MASINYAAREISVKIVYYGPGLSGKTTNLQIIHKKVPKDFKSDMVSLATETDRTLFFDFLPLDLGKIKGFSAKFQLYTVPGQVYYNATRKLVLRGVDGIVFVADSAADKMQENIESFQNLLDNLAEYGYKREQVPIIIQYNKRDLPNALPVNQIDQVINRFSLPWTEASAVKGQGVFESLKLIGKIVIDDLNRKYSRQSRSAKTSQTQASPLKRPQQSTPPQGMGNNSTKNTGAPSSNPPYQQPLTPRPQMPQQQAHRSDRTGPNQQWGTPNQMTPPPSSQINQPFTPPVGSTPPQHGQRPVHNQQSPNFGQMPLNKNPNQPMNRQPGQDDPFLNSRPGSVPPKPAGQDYYSGRHGNREDGYGAFNMEPPVSGFKDSTAKSDLDMEIERYQQEIYKQNVDMGQTQFDFQPPQSPNEGFAPQNQGPYNPNDYAGYDQNIDYGQEYNYNQNDYAFGNYGNGDYGNQQYVQENESNEDEATFEIESPSSQFPYGNNYAPPGQQNQNYNYYQNQEQNNQYGADQMPGNQFQPEKKPNYDGDDDKPMYFTSVDMDHPPKKGKKPVNPKNKPKKGFLGMFKKNKFDDDDDFL